jgi:putative peptidoglycan lipid II flippase
MQSYFHTTCLFVRRAGPLCREPALVVALFGVVAVLLGFMREQSIGLRLGMSAVTDAFYLGLTLISFLPGLVSGACLGVLAPRHARTVKVAGDAAGRALLGQMLFVCLALGVVAMLVLVLVGAVSYPLFAAIPQADQLRLTLSMCAGLALAVPALCFSSGAVASLNVLGRYALGGASGTIAPLVTIAALHLASNGPVGLVTGMVLGLTSQAAVLGWALAREGVVATRKPRWAQVQPVLRDMGLLATGGLAAGLTTMAVQALVAGTGAHAVSAYTFGTKVTWSYLGLTVLVLSTVLTPLLSARAAGLPYSRRRLRAYLWLAAVAALGGMVLLMVGAEQVIQLFLGRGAFSEADVKAVAHVQLVSALQIPSYLLLFLGSRAVQAYHDIRFVSRMSWLQACLAVGTAWALVPSFGTTGILLAIAGAYLFSGLFYCWRYQHLRRRARQA